MSVQSIENGGLSPLRPAKRVLEALSALPDDQFAQRLLVKADGRLTFVKAGDVDWFEADRNYIRLHVGATVHVIRERISQLESTLDPRQFARIHRSIIVRLASVREVNPWSSGDSIVILHDGTELRLSRHYRHQVERSTTP